MRSLVTLTILLAAIAIVAGGCTARQGSHLSLADPKPCLVDPMFPDMCWHREGNSMYFVERK